MTDDQDPVRTARELLKAARSTVGPFTALPVRSPSDKRWVDLAVTPEWYDLIAAAPGLLARLADEVERLREEVPGKALTGEVREKHDQTMHDLLAKLIAFETAPIIAERDRLAAAVVAETKRREAAEDQAARHAISFNTLRDRAEAAERQLDALALRACTGYCTRAEAAEAATHKWKTDCIHARNMYAAAEARVRELEERNASLEVALDDDSRPYETGAADERAAVVAYLRRDIAVGCGGLIDDAANAIEAGAHRGEGGAT